MVTGKFVYLRQQCALPYDARPAESYFQLYKDEVQLANVYHFEAMVPFGSDTSTRSQEMSGSLPAAYREFKHLCEALGCYHIHSYARELYEKSWASGNFACSPQNTVIAGCLFIAFSDTRSPLYVRQRAVLAPSTKKEKEIYESLERFFNTPIVGIKCSRMDEAGDLSKPLLSAYNEIQAFCDRFSLPQSVTSYAKFLFEFVYERVDFETHEVDVVMAGCFYIACRQMKMPKTYAAVQCLTNIQSTEIEAIVNDLEDFFSAQREVEKQEQEKAGDLPWGPGYISAFDVTNSLKGVEYQDPGRVRIVYTIYSYVVRPPSHQSLPPVPSDCADESTTEVLTPAAGVGDRIPLVPMSPRGGEKEDKKTGTAVYGSKVTIRFSRKFRDGKSINYSLPGDIVTFTLGKDCMNIDALHFGVKGMSVGGKRRLVVPASYAFSAGERDAFFGESGTNREVVFDLELLEIEWMPGNGGTPVW